MCYRHFTFRIFFSFLPMALHLPLTTEMSTRRLCTMFFRVHTSTIRSVRLCTWAAPKETCPSPSYLWSWLCAGVGSKHFCLNSIIKHGCLQSADPICRWLPAARQTCANTPGERCIHGSSLRHSQEPPGRSFLHWSSQTQIQKSNNKSTNNWNHVDNKQHSIIWHPTHKGIDEGRELCGWSILDVQLQ